MTPLRQPMRAARQRRGQGERPQPSSVRAVRLLAQCDGTAPALLSAQELPASFLHRTNIAGLTPAAMRLCSRGIRFVSQLVLTRDGQTRSVLRPHTAPRLPAVRRVEEVGRLRKATTPWHHQAACTTVSRVRLRLHAALSLQGSASDGQRLQGPLPRGTGATDRASPLPDETRARRRPAWTTPRHTTWRLPATGRGSPTPSSGDLPAEAPAGPGRLPHRHTPGRHDHHRRGQPSASPGVRPPAARRGRAPPSQPAPPGAHPTRHDDACLPPHPTRACSGLRTPPLAQARAPAMRTRRALCPAGAPASLERSPPLPLAHRTGLRALPQGPSGPEGQRLAQGPPCGTHHRLHHAGGNRHWPQGPEETPPPWLHTPREQPRPGPPWLLPCPSLRPCARGAARLTPAPPRPWARRLPRPSHGARTSSAAAARTGPPSPGSCTPGADRARTTLPSLPSCRVAVVPQTVTRGSPREPPALSPCTPSPPSPARAATQPGATPDGERSATPRAGRAPGTATATPPPPAPRLSQTAPRRSAPWPSPTAAWGAAPTGPSRAPPAHPTGHAHALSPSTPWRCSAGASRTAGPMA